MTGGSLKVATIGGIKIYVHWSWLLIFVLLTWSLGAGFFPTHFHGWSTGTDYIVAAIAAILLFVTVLIHELSHSFTARARGLPVESITLFIFGGVSNLSEEPRSAPTELLVAFAGPLASLILAGIFYLLYLALHSGPSEVWAIFGYLWLVNLLLAVFNLIPGYPLDGGRVLHSLIWMATGSLRRATRIATTVGEIVAWIFILGGLWIAFFRGDIIDGIWLAFIGWFLHNAAGATYQQSVLQRTLAGMDVRNLMDPPPPSVGGALSVADVIYDHMLGQSRSFVAVQNPDGTFAGIVTLGDVQHVGRDDWTTTPVRQIMQPAEGLVTVTPDEDLTQAMTLLASHGYDQLPVVQNGDLVGVLSRAHVLAYLHTRQALGLTQQGSGPRGGTPAQPVG